MATETKAREIPPYVESIMKAATDAGLEVVRNTNSIKISAANGKRGQTFSIPRNPYPTAPQLRSSMARHGFLAKVKYDPSAAEAPAEKDEPKKTAEKTGHACPDCDHPPFARPQALGLHRRMKHGVVGMSDEAIRKREIKAAKNQQSPSADPATGPTPPPVPAQAPAPAAETDARPQIVTPATSGLPDKVSAAVAALVHAVGSETANTATLHAENARLRAFKDKVTAEATNGNQTPIQTVANIEALCRAADQQ
ncbi:hypothetical protein [Streptomyces sp. MH60]|uniref:hypothetical protein n=1 Tax=Streptomyces sp. MH60 TaxID=1940758 RepID=UPI000CEE5586|nr:hypothetical protein [Streptomyces sp. MH60]PPS89544.1 hypothetical protein BZZ08_01691 [Streptomyces sp. MH60]